MKNHQSNNTTTRQYHPYQDFQTTPVHKLYDLPTSPEILFHEESLRRRRFFSENLAYFTGTGYLSGAALGAVRGTLDGLRAAERGETVKLRINRVLNSGGSTGRRFANSVGVLGLIYAGMESFVTHKRGEDDSLNSVIAGLAAGAIYRAASGPRSAVIAGAIGGITAAVAVHGKRLIKRYALI